MIRKLILGTAGLSGKPYGRNNRIIPELIAHDLINHAYEAGIHAFDTAPAYGNAEKILGDTLGDRAAVVYTKTDGLKTSARHSLNNYGSPVTIHYLWHNYFNQPTASWIDGASIYSRDLPDKLIDRRFIMQMDWNILNQTKFPICKRRIARSVFLQGILAGEKCPDKKLAEAIKKADKHAAKMKMPLFTLALRAALQNRGIDYVIIGPTDFKELEMCLEVAKMDDVALGDIASLHIGGTTTDPRTLV